MIALHIIAVAAGGAVGSVARFLIQKLFSETPISFPLGTFLVNIMGCFLIGVFHGWWDRQSASSSELQLLAVTGFCGGFTTFSAFTFEGMELIRDQRIFLFFVYFVSSVVLGVLSTFAGAWVSR